MKFFKINLVIIFFLSTNLFSQDMIIIELHPSSADGEVKQNEIQQEELLDDVIFSNENEINAN